MPYVERSIQVAADPKAVYTIAKEMESFPKFMPNVKEVVVVSREPQATITRWHVHVIGRDLRWTERDEFDEQAPAIRYKQLEGDIRKFEGEWRFLPEDGGCRVELTCDAELGVPMLDNLFNPVLKKAIEMNIDSMLSAIKEMAEGRGDVG